MKFIYIFIASIFLCSTISVANDLDCVEACGEYHESNIFTKEDMESLEKENEDIRKKIEQSKKDLARHEKLLEDTKITPLDLIKMYFDQIIMGNSGSSSFSEED